MPKYTLDEQDDLEDAAEAPRPDAQSKALQLIAQILEQHSIAYAVMGGMNVFLRGSLRTTTDVDIAVDNPPKMEVLLDIFNDHSNIHRPSSRLQWASGVARIFVDVGSIVQFDLMPKGSDGLLVPQDLATSTERWTVPSTSQPFECSLLLVEHMVATKLRAHHNRGAGDDVTKQSLPGNDYVDLQYICLNSRYAPLIRAFSANYRQEWKVSFLNEVRVREEPEADAIAWAMGE